MTIKRISVFEMFGACNEILKHVGSLVDSLIDVDCLLGLAPNY